MRRTKMVLAVAGLMIAMFVVLAVPAMANDRDNNNHKNNDNDKNNHHNRFFDHDDDDDDDIDDDVRFVFRDAFSDDDSRNRRFDFDDFDFDFDSDLDQDADSGDVDQSFVVTNTGDNSNQCANVQGVANTGNAQNQLGITQIGSDGDNNNHNWWNNRNHNWWWNNNHNWWNNGKGIGDFEVEDADSSIDVSPISTATCDQQVNQAA